MVGGSEAKSWVWFWVPIRGQFCFFGGASEEGSFFCGGLVLFYTAFLWAPLVVFFGGFVFAARTSTVKVPGAVDACISVPL